MSPNQQDLVIFMVVFNKTILPFALVGYKMIKANSALRASLAIYHLIFNAFSWNNDKKLFQYSNTPFYCN